MRTHLLIFACASNRHRGFDISFSQLAHNVKVLNRLNETEDCRVTLDSHCHKLSRGVSYLCIMNSQKIAKAITLVGLATTMTGLTFKLNHLMGAPIIFNIGVAILVIGLVLWAFGLIQKK